MNYDSSSVIVREGETAHSGHHIAFVQMGTSAAPMWYECNDSIVREVCVNVCLAFVELW